MITCPPSSAISDQAMRKRMGEHGQPVRRELTTAQTTTDTGCTLRSRMAAKTEG